MTTTFRGFEESEMFQLILKAFLVTVLLLPFGSAAVAQEVLVQERPTYNVGEYVQIEIPIPADMTGLVGQGVGTVSIRAESKGAVQKDGRIWTLFKIDVTLGSVSLYSGNGYMSQETWSSHLKFNETLYRMDTNIQFPLHSGDVFINTLMASGPCPSSRGTCMQVVKTEQCYGTRRVAQGIEYTCDGEGDERTRYVVDHQFKWPVGLEIVN